MKSIRLIVTSLFISIGIIFTLNAQNAPQEGSLGLRASVVTSQMQIEVPYMLNEELSLAPTLGFNTVEDGTTTFQIGVRPRYYTTTTGSVGTYFTGNLAINSTSVDNGPSFTDVLFGVGYGAEYFFSDMFSVSTDANVNATFGDSPTAFGTGARVSATVYF